MNLFAKTILRVLAVAVGTSGSAPGASFSMQKLDKSVELVQTLLASKKFRAWKPETIHHKRSDGAVKKFEYKGKNPDLFPSYSYQNNNANPKRPFEKHYTPAEVAQIWGISVDMARDLFRGEEDVLKLERTGSKKYVTLRIPESVLLRVHTRMSRA